MGVASVWMKCTSRGSHCANKQLLPKEAMDKVTAEGTDGTTTSSQKKKKSRSKDLPSDLQPSPQSFQGSLQVSPCHSQHTKKKESATTPNKSGSSKKEEKHSSRQKHHGKGKSSKDKSSKDKSSKPSKDKHHGKDKSSKDKSGKKKK